jgi:hypothetical protein
MVAGQHDDANASRGAALNGSADIRPDRIAYADEPKRRQLVWVLR